MAAMPTISTPAPDGSLRYGPAYLSAAMAYGRHWVSTKRNVVSPGFAALESDYDANSFGGRLEAGYRYGWNSLGITPYAALQATVVRLPAYAENATGGSDAFALQYGRQSDSLYRTELGSWLDHSRVIPGGVMTLRARAAWAHDEGADRTLNGAFPALPGSTFLVQGAFARKQLRAAQRGRRMEDTGTACRFPPASTANCRIARAATAAPERSATSGDVPAVRSAASARLPWRAIARDRPSRRARA